MPQPIDHQDVVITTGRGGRVQVTIHFDAFEAYEAAGVRQHRTGSQGAIHRETSQHEVEIRGPARQAGSPGPVIAKVWWQTQLESTAPIQDLVYTQSPLLSGEPVQPARPDPQTPSAVDIVDEKGGALHVTFVAYSDAAHEWVITESVVEGKRSDTWALQESDSQQVVMTGRIEVDPGVSFEGTETTGGTASRGSSGSR